MEEPLSGTPSPEQLAHDSREGERLLAAIRTLPLGQRQVLTLVLEGLSQAKVGETLGLSENAVAVRIHRARSHLRQAMSREALHG